MRTPWFPSCACAAAAALLAACVLACGSVPSGPRGAGRVRGIPVPAERMAGPGGSAAGTRIACGDTDDEFALWTPDRIAEPERHVRGVRAPAARTLEDAADALRVPLDRRGYAIAVFRSDRGVLGRLRVRLLGRGDGPSLEIVDLERAVAGHLRPRASVFELEPGWGFDLDRARVLAPGDPTPADFRFRLVEGRPRVEPGEHTSLFFPIESLCRDGAHAQPLPRG